ncbi:hypothetical protein EMH17_29555, partial [Klebsiella pneumoniae]
PAPAPAPAGAAAAAAVVALEAEAAAAGTTRRTPGGRPQGLLLGGGPSIIAQRRQGVLVHGHLSELLEGRLI